MCRVTDLRWGERPSNASESDAGGRPRPGAAGERWLPQIGWSRAERATEPPVRHTPSRGLPRSTRTQGGREKGEDARPGAGGNET